MSGDAGRRDERGPTLLQEMTQARARGYAHALITTPGASKAKAMKAALIAEGCDPGEVERLGSRRLTQMANRCERWLQQDDEFQEMLAARGVTREKLAQVIADALGATTPLLKGRMRVGNTEIYEHEERPDHRTRLAAVRLPLDISARAAEIDLRRQIQSRPSLREMRLMVVLPPKPGESRVTRLEYKTEADSSAVSEDDSAV